MGKVILFLTLVLIAYVQALAGASTTETDPDMVQFAS